MMFRIFLLSSALLTSACAYDNMKKVTYDALHTRDCLITEGHTNCDPDRPSYEEYEKQRQAMKKD